MRMSLYSHSSAGCKFLTHCRNIWWSMTSLGWVRFYPELNPISNWRKWWRAPPTTLPNTAMKEKSPSHIMKLLPKPRTQIMARPPTRDKRSQFSHWIRSRPWSRQSSSPRFGSLLTSYSTPSRTNHRLGVRYRSNITPHSPRVEKYCSFYESKGHKTIHCKNIWRYLE